MKRRGMDEEEWKKGGESEVMNERDGDGQLDRIYLLSILCPLSMNPV
jgi:hypothetical protein